MASSRGPDPGLLEPFHGTAPSSPCFYPFFRQQCLSFSPLETSSDSSPAHPSPRCFCSWANLPRSVHWASLLLGLLVPSLFLLIPARAVGLLKPWRSSVGLREAREEGRAFKGGRVGCGCWGHVGCCKALYGPGRVVGLGRGTLNQLAVGVSVPQERSGDVSARQVAPSPARLSDAEHVPERLCARPSRAHSFGDHFSPGVEALWIGGLLLPALRAGTGLQTGQEGSTPASPSSWPAEGESGYLGLSRELSAAPKELQALILSPPIFSRLLL